MGRPKQPNCPRCKVMPKGFGLSYCCECHSFLCNRSSRDKSLKKKSRQVQLAYGWKNAGSKKPPTDWREVLRKADEGQS